VSGVELIQACIPEQIVSQYFAMGMHPSGQELASLGQDSAIGSRDGMMVSPSPPRMVELVPVDGVAIDMPPYDDVSSYDKMIREYNAQVSTLLGAFR
jgi:hypothetical protein